MRRLLSLFSLPCVAAVCICTVAGLTSAESIQWVTVGDPGNVGETQLYKTPPPDGPLTPLTFGSVATSYRIMKYEFTNQQYADFLNSAARPDTYSLYNPDMGTDARGGITRSGVSGSYSYSVKQYMGDKPVNYVSWFDAARVSNWYQNGATNASSTETGAYTLGGAISGAAPAVNAGAKYFIPTEDMWYKAAYYKGGGTNAGYWNYATQSDTLPSAVTADEFGIGSATSGNFSNIGQTADWNGQNGNVVTVGTAGGPSGYGAYNMEGNVSEWNDLAGLGGAGDNGDQEGRRGGNWKSVRAPGNDGSIIRNLAIAGGGTIPGQGQSENAQVGFRLANSSVPEIDPNSLGSVLALVLGSLGLLERRRARLLGNA
jgi:formylglycine-generating enzyme required for sulfatase activity